jgi:signal transduction histidine kinase
VAASIRFSYHALLARILSEADYATALEGLAEALPLGVAAVDRSGRVFVWNGALASAHRPREEALGKPLLEALPALASDRNVDWREALDAVLRGGPALDRPRVPLGGRLVRATLSPLAGREGKPVGAVLVLEDITDRERGEERRLRRVRSRAVEDLGAGIAHEIRNPLNALSLNLQLLRERLEDPAVSRGDLTAKADAMVAEMKRIEDLVAHLLEVSRGSPPARETGLVDDVAGRVVDRLQETAERAGVDLSLRAGSRRPIVLDPVRVDRALHNLVRNAIEAAPAGGHVWVSTRDEPHTTVVVVEDDGPGFPPEDRERLFELFYTRKRGGTGLGLPLARRAVEDHGGEVEILDRPGGGARVVVYLPIDEEAREGPDASRGEPWRGS